MQIRCSCRFFYRKYWFWPFLKNQDFYQNFKGFLAISRVRNVRFSKFKRFWNQQTKPVKMTYNLTYVLKKSPWDNKPVDQVVVAVAWQQDRMRFYWFFFWPVKMTDQASYAKNFRQNNWKTKNLHAFEFRRKPSAPPFISFWQTAAIHHQLCHDHAE